MLRFEHIELLSALAVIPVLVIAYIINTRHKRRELAQFGDPELMAQLMPNASRVRPTVKFSILMVTLALLIISAARPQFGTGEQKVEKEGIEAVIALDISNSMLAEDVAPNRLIRAKQMVSKLMDNMLNDKIGMVVFAGDAYVQLPITADFVSAKMFLDGISPSQISLQGTAIGAAINKSVECFGEPKDVSRVLILITDGENHEDDAVSAAQRAKEAGIKVVVVGIGTTKGTFLPDPDKNDKIRDAQGVPVVSKLNEQMCQEVASAGEGLYVHCDNTNSALKEIEKLLEDLATQKFEEHVMTNYNEQYHSFALIALLLLIVEFFIFNRKNKIISRMDIFGKGAAVLLVLLTLGTTDVMAQRESHDIRSGNSDYEENDYRSAVDKYKAALEIKDDSYAAQYNLGNAYYRLAESEKNDSIKCERYQDAMKAYSKAAKLMDKDHMNDPVRYSKAWYNIGNCSYKMHECYKRGLEQLSTVQPSPELDEKTLKKATKNLQKAQNAALLGAQAAYVEALKNDPKDEEARKNLAKVNTFLQPNPQSGGGQGDSDDDQNEQEEQQQQEQQQQQQDQEEQEQNEEQMNEERAEQILRALQEDEKETQQKRQEPVQQKYRPEKNW